MTNRTLSGRVAIVGIGESRYFKAGQSPDPEFKLTLAAVLAACKDARLDPREIDGFASFGNDRGDAVRLATALDVHRMRSATMQWGGGGGGCCAAVANAAAAIVSGLANCVLVTRGLAQGQHGRYGQSSGTPNQGPEMAYQSPYGVLAPPHKFAMKVRRFMHDHGIGHEPLRAIAMASSLHAQANPRAVMYGKPLTDERYDASRWIVEPFRLFDCCMENDGACALILVPAERAKEFPNPGVFLLGAGSGSDRRAGALAHNAPDYASANVRGVASDVYAMAGLGPSDVGVAQCYENFTGGVMMTLAEHGLFEPREAASFLTLENLSAPSGRLPLNTSGGNLAECYVQGLELVLEAARQVRGQSTSQALRHDVALVAGGPMVAPASSLLLGSEATT